MALISLEFNPYPTAMTVILVDLITYRLVAINNGDLKDDYKVLFVKLSEVEPNM